MKIINKYKYLLIFISLILIFAFIPSIYEYNYIVRDKNIIEIIKYVISKRNTNNILGNLIYQLLNTKYVLKIVFEAGIITYLTYVLNKFNKKNISLVTALLLGLGLNIIIKVIFSLKSICFYVIPTIIIIKTFYLIINKEISKNKYIKILILTIISSLFGIFYTITNIIILIFAIIYKIEKKNKLIIPLIIEALIITIQIFLNYKYYSNFEINFNFIERISYNLFYDKKLMYNFIFNLIALIFILNALVLSKFKECNIKKKILILISTIINILLLTISIIYKNNYCTFILNNMFYIFILYIITIYLFNREITQYDKNTNYILTIIITMFIANIEFNNSINYGIMFTIYSIVIIYIIYLINNYYENIKLNIYYKTFTVVIYSILLTCTIYNNISFNNMIKDIKKSTKKDIYIESKILLYDYIDKINYKNMYIFLINKADMQYFSAIFVLLNNNTRYIELKENFIKYYNNDEKPYYFDEYIKTHRKSE